MRFLDLVKSLQIFLKMMKNSIEYPAQYTQPQQQLNNQQKQANNTRINSMFQQVSKTSFSKSYENNYEERLQNFKGQYAQQKNYTNQQLFMMKKEIEQLQAKTNKRQQSYKFYSDNVNYANSQLEQLKQFYQSCEDRFKQSQKHLEEQAFKYQKKISEQKIALSEIQQSHKQKAYQFTNKMILKIQNLEQVVKNIETLQYKPKNKKLMISKINQSNPTDTQIGIIIAKQFKQLKKKIKQSTKESEKNQQEMSLHIQTMKNEINQKLTSQKNALSQNFETHYEALEKIIATIGKQII